MAEGLGTTLLLAHMPRLPASQPGGQSSGMRTSQAWADPVCGSEKRQ